MQNTATELTTTTSSQLGEVPRERLQQAVESLTSTQLNWASGYLAGLCAAPRPAKQPAAPASMTILYATQGGNAQSVAAERGYPARLKSVSTNRTRALAKENLTRPLGRIVFTLRCRSQTTATPWRLCGADRRGAAGHYTDRELS